MCSYFLLFVTSFLLPVYAVVFYYPPLYIQSNWFTLNQTYAILESVLSFCVAVLPFVGAVFVNYFLLNSFQMEHPSLAFYLLMMHSLVTIFLTFSMAVIYRGPLSHQASSFIHLTLLFVPFVTLLLVSLLKVFMTTLFRGGAYPALFLKRLNCSHNSQNVFYSLGITTIIICLSYGFSSNEITSQDETLVLGGAFFIYWGVFDLTVGIPSEAKNMKKYLEP